MRIAFFCVGLVGLSVALAAGCAQGSSDSSSSGVGGDVSSGSGGATTSSSGKASSSGQASTSSGSTTSTSSSSGAASSSSGAGGGTSSSSTSSTSSSGSSCGAQEHDCSGICQPNTPDTGCLTASASCTPCPVPPNGMSTCTAGGACDVTCNAGWMKSGSACVCGSQCCSDSDCQNGDTCSAGTCQAAPPACDIPSCTAACTIFKMKVCPGVCVPACACLC